MSRSRLLPAATLLAVLALALVVLMAATPAGAQFVVELTEVFATPIPLSGADRMDWPTPAPRSVYIASDPLQSPPVTPMP
ncbi:MAG: hypothetical protein K6U78_14685 [Anaerolineae bacterium]|nr:hypothetical protein [Anaerolineae bacterium]